MSAKKKSRITKTKTKAAVPTAAPDAIGPAKQSGVVETRIANWLRLFESHEDGMVTVQRDTRTLFVRQVPKAVHCMLQACVLWTEIVNALLATSFHCPSPLGSGPTTVTLTFQDAQGQVHGKLVIPIFRYAPSPQESRSVRAMRPAADLSPAGGGAPMIAATVDEARLDRAAIVHYLNTRAQKLQAATGPGRGSPADRAVRLIQADTLQDAARVVQEGRYLP